MASMTFVIEGDVSVQVTVTELDGGDLQFDLLVLDGAMTADIQGLFFDLSDDSLADGLNVTGLDATDWQFDANDVTNLGQGVNVNGEIVNEYGAFDAGVQIGTSGMAKDDIQSTSFIISHDTADLTLADVALQDFAVRLTSVGEEDGSRTGSLKLGTTAPDVDPEVGNIAVNDAMTVGNADNFADGFDFLVDDVASILANDLGATGPYAGDVTGVAGSDANIGTIVTGSNGGLMIINADGTVNFSANGDFDGLGLRDSAQTVFTYEIDGGSTAEIVVTVTGFNDGEF